jgi:hypothetical protein
MRGTITKVNQSPTSTVSVGVTTSAGGSPLGNSSGTQPAGNPLGVTVTGTIQENGTNNVYNFIQPYGIEMGIQQNSRFEFQTVQDSTGATWAVSLRPVDRGIIQSVNPPVNNVSTGTLIEVSSGHTLTFVQPFAQQLGVTPQVKVSFETVVDPNSAKTTAVSLEVS